MLNPDAVLSAPWWLRAKDGLRRWATGRDVAARERHRTPSWQQRSRSDPEALERIAAYARSGYFHMGYTASLFVFPPVIPLE